jgi:hypothetical protein
VFIRAALEGTYEPGEALQDWVYAQRVPLSYLGTELLIGSFAIFTVRPYYIAVTDRRLFAIPSPRFTTKKKRRTLRLVPEIAEPFNNLVCERRRGSPGWMRLLLRRRTDGRALVSASSAGRETMLTECSAR